MVAQTSAIGESPLGAEVNIFVLPVTETLTLATVLPSCTVQFTQEIAIQLGEYYQDDFQASWAKVPPLETIWIEEDSI